MSIRYNNSRRNSHGDHRRDSTNANDTVETRIARFRKAIEMEICFQMEAIRNNPRLTDDQRAAKLAEKKDLRYAALEAIGDQAITAIMKEAKKQIAM
mgnify:CR=1 FL=1